MLVVFQQADLDTCLAAAISGVTEADPAFHRHNGALPDELADSAVLCLEAGGSGQAHLNNFDHHNTAQPLYCAARQAFVAFNHPAEYRLLVEFAEVVDTGGPRLSAPFPNVSHLVSGIRIWLSEDPVGQLRTATTQLRRISQMRLDPFEPLPRLPDWACFFETRRHATERLAVSLAAAEVVRVGNLNVAFAETASIGAPGFLYHKGAQIAVVHRPGKFVIGGNGIRVDGLLPFLNAGDPGWGGPAHGTIIGSPRSGSKLTFTEVRKIVEESCRMLSISALRT